MNPFMNRPQLPGRNRMMMPQPQVPGPGIPRPNPISPPQMSATPGGPNGLAQLLGQRQAPPQGALPPLGATLPQEQMPQQTQQPAPQGGTQQFIQAALQQGHDPHSIMQFLAQKLNLRP